MKKFKSMGFLGNKGYLYEVNFLDISNNIRFYILRYKNTMRIILVKIHFHIIRNFINIYCN